MAQTAEINRRGLKSLTGRWKLATRALRKEDQKYGEQLVQMIEKHSCTRIHIFDDPLEAAMFSIMIEMMIKSEPAYRKPDAIPRISRDGILASGEPVN